MRIRKDRKQKPQDGQSDAPEPVDKNILLREIRGRVRFSSTEGPDLRTMGAFPDRNFPGIAYRTSEDETTKHSNYNANKD